MNRHPFWIGSFSIIWFRCPSVAVCWFYPYQQLSPVTCSRLDALLASSSEVDGGEFKEKENSSILTFRQLLASPSKPSVNTMDEEVKKLLSIHHLQISDDLFKQIAPKLVMKYLLRAATETITKLDAHPARIRYSLLALLFWCRKKEVIDHLGDLLEKITHKIGKKAENRGLGSNRTENWNKRYWQ